MKKLILAIMILVPMGLAAQSKNFNELFKKYEGSEGFVCMNLSGDMLQSMLPAADSIEGVDADKAAETLKNISSVALIVVEEINNEFRSDVKAVLDKGKYKSLLSLDAENNKINFYVLGKDANKGDDKEKEMMLVVNTDDGTDVVIGMIGKGNIQEILKQINLN